MDMLSDVALLSRIQFALTVAYHFIFVPLSIGLGLILAIFATKYYRSRSEADGNAMRFWVRIFTATFAIGVAGHHHGVPVRHELGVLFPLRGRHLRRPACRRGPVRVLPGIRCSWACCCSGCNKVSSLFYTVSAWLVWAGSC